VPRAPRFDEPGTLHHVTIRSVEGRRLFPTDGDSLDLLQRFARWLRATESECIAWSLDGNHAHWVLRRGSGSLAELMGRFTSAFAQHFNWRYGRVGHLFQGRYQSRRITDERDLRWVVLYAMGNPVRHGLGDVPWLDEYAFSGWSGLIGARPAYEFESFDMALSLYGETVAEARANLRDALALAIATRWRPPADDRVEVVIAEVCRRRGIPRSAVLGVACDAREAQTEVILQAVASHAIPRRALAAALGISQSRITRAQVAASRERR
jgi:REP element-mobilizing transposase RayT